MQYRHPSTRVYALETSWLWRGASYERLIREKHTAFEMWHSCPSVLETIVEEVNSAAEDDVRFDEYAEKLDVAVRVAGPGMTMVSPERAAEVTLYVRTWDDSLRMKVRLWGQERSAMNFALRDVCMIVDDYTKELCIVERGQFERDEERALRLHLRMLHARDDLEVFKRWGEFTDSWRS
jgi:hypothetical protein